jgi:hypothetical protein
MSRVATGGGDVVVRKPQNNIYTVLTLAGLVATVLGLIVVFMRASALGIDFMKG